jgi:GH24 family phage-related lysozyme (muramidase)
VAAFAQLAVVHSGSNTRVYVIAIFTMCESTERRICIKFCFKIGKTAMETYQLLQKAYREDALGRTQVYDWFHRFKEGRTSVESDPAWDDRQHREMTK